MTETNLATQIAFDYGELCHEDWKFVHDVTDEIKRLGKLTTENILEIGRLLTEVKARLTHGQFCRWLAAEFHSSERQAQRLMSAHLVFGKTDTMSDLASFLEPTVVYQLAAPSTPEPARQEVLAKVEQGERVTTKKVKAVVAKHKPSKRERRLRQNLGERRAEQFVQAYPELTEPKKKGPITHLIDTAIHVLSMMAKVAKAAENGDENALRQIIDGARQVDDLCLRLLKWNAEAIEPEPVQKIGEEEVQHEHHHQGTGEEQTEQRISPRTGKPVRKYTRRASTNGLATGTDDVRRSAAGA
jgi:hypothetical protein